MKPNGLIFYDGPSLLDGAPIVGVAVGLVTPSTNPVTRGMVQTCILRKDVGPVEAVQAGADASICGDCRFRGDHGKGRACYVNLGQGPRSVWVAMRAGAYPVARRVGLITRGKGGEPLGLRVGTYGDPGAVPVAVWLEMLEQTPRWTAYTHQWRTAPDLREFCMASVDTPAERLEAKAAGWRTFRVGHDPEPGEIQCPVAVGVACLDCLLCRGTAVRAKDILDTPSGPGARFAG